MLSITYLLGLSRGRKTTRESAANARGVIDLDKGPSA